MELQKLTEIELQMMVDEGERILPYQLQVMAINAKALAARLNLLVDEGFTRQEAIEIIKARGTE